MVLFQQGDFVLSSGRRARFKIDCDALFDADVATVAAWLVTRLPGPFGSVEGVPRGGLRLADACRAYVTQGPVLIVDDVLTTGESMERQRGGRDALGAVIFARGPVPSWVTPLCIVPPRGVCPSDFVGALRAIRGLAGQQRTQRALHLAVEREVVALRRHIRIGAQKGRERRRLRDEALVAYMNARTTPERDAAFLRTYSARVRTATAATWKIPNTVATTLEDIALRVERIAAERDRLQSALKRIVADQDIGHGGAWCVAVATQALADAP